MQSTTVLNSKTRIEVEASMPVEEFSKYLDEAAKELSKDLKIKGFRGGHMPRNLVEKELGSARLYNRAAERAARATFDKALEGRDVKNEYLPQVQITKLAPDNPFVYKVILYRPFFELCSDYKNVVKTVRDREVKEVKVEDKEVDDTLQWLARNRSAKNDKQENTGKESEIKVDDVFAKSLGNFQDLQALKNSIREGILREKEKKEKDRVRLAVIREIIARSVTDIPEKIIDNEISKIEREFKNRIEEMGADFDEYLKKIQKTKEELHGGWRDQAKERVELSLVLSAVAQKEQIEPSEDEVEREAQKLLNQLRTAGEEGEGVDSAGLKEYVRGILRNEKTFEFLDDL